MNNLLRLFVLFRPYWTWMALAIVLALVTLLANAALLATAGWFITAMGLAGAAGASMNYFTPAALIRAFAITRTAGRYAERVVSHEATFRLLAHLRVWLYNHLEPLAPAALGDLRSGDILQRLQGDVDRMEQVFLRLFAPIVTAILASLAITAFTALYAPALAAVMLLLLLAAGVLLPLVMERAGRTASRRIAVNQARLETALVDLFEGIGDLHLHDTWREARARIDQIDDAIISDQLRLASGNGVIQAAIALAANLTLWAALILVIPLVSADSLTAPELTMLALLALASFEAIAPVPTALQTLAATLASADRLFALVDAARPVTEPATPKPLPSDTTVRLENVSLTYPGAAAPALSSIDLALRPATRTLVIGPSGSGKSSLVNLLLRFHTPGEGRITLGGMPVDQFATDDVRRQITAVPQRVHLFTATIADNLRLAHPSATDADLEAACRAAQIHDFISAQPAAYDTFVGAAGLKLSGGQVRRIAIARALLKPDAPIVILDEPTEGIDTITARKLMDALLDTLRDRAVLIISHRPVMITAFDEIIRLEGGRIVERGPPEHWLDADGTIRTLGRLIDD